MDTEIIKVYYGSDIFESTSREEVIKWVDNYIEDYCEDEREYLDLHCGPQICTCLESDNNFNTIHVESIWDDVENDSVIGYYKGANIRRNNNMENAICISFEEEIMMNVIFSKMTYEEYRNKNINYKFSKEAQKELRENNGDDLGEILRNEMSKITDSCIEDAYLQVSAEEAMISSVKRDMDFKKENGSIIDYQIESIDEDENGNPRVIVNMTLNRPIENINLDFNIGNVDD